MHVNMTKFEIKVSRRDDPDHYLQLEFRLQNNEMDYPISPMLFSEQHIDHLCAQLNGIVPWNRKYAFSDISYQIVNAGTDGLNIWHRNGSKLDDHYFHFPGKVVATDIQLACAQAVVAKPQNDRWGKPINPTISVVYDAETIEQWRETYAPKFRYWFAPAAKERYLSIMRGTSTEEYAKLLTDENRLRLKQYIQGLKGWAANRSNGEEWTIEVYTDFVEFSFGWTVYNGKHERVINGGIIAHARRDGPQEKYYDKPIVGYEYSMHT